jgi:ATP-binding cassette subfamily F protein 3
MVSHDRHLIGLVCDTFWRVADGKVEPFDGDLDAYAAWLRTRPAAQGTKQKMAELAPAPPPKPAAASAKRPPNPHKLAEAEAKVGRLEEKLAGIDALLADPKVFSDAVRLAELGRERETARRDLEAAEQAWSALYDAV